MKEVSLVLYNIRSRENVGSIFRTADAVGVSKIYLCGITPTPQSKNPVNPVNQASITSNLFHDREINYNDKIAKTALGAEKWVPWEYQKQAWRLLIKLKKDKINIVALEQTKESVGLFKFKPKFPIALVVGNEVKGLSPQILKYCDKKISIPMYGKKESLNVAVAAGVALYTIKER